MWVNSRLIRQLLFRDLPDNDNNICGYENAAVTQGRVLKRTVCNFKIVYSNLEFFAIFPFFKRNHSNDSATFSLFNHFSIPYRFQYT